jgi:hypothetical protein
MASGIDSGQVIAVADVKGAQEFGISSQLSEWEIEHSRLCARRFGIE